MREIIRVAVIFTVVVVVYGCTRERSELGEEYFKNGQYQEAVDEYSRILAIKPRSLEVLYNRGRAYQELGDIIKATIDFEKVLKLNNDHVQAHLSLGNIDFLNEDYEGAYYQFNAVVKKYKQNSDGLMYRGKANFKLGKIREAQLDYDAAIRVNSQNGYAFLYRGALKVNRKRVKSACADFSKADALGVPDATEALDKYCR